MSFADDAYFQRRLFEADEAYSSDTPHFVFSFPAEDAIAKLRVAGVTFTALEVDELADWITSCAQFLDRYSQLVARRTDAQVIVQASRVILSRLPPSGAFGEFTKLPYTELSLQSAADAVEAIEDGYRSILEQSLLPKGFGVGERSVHTTRNVYWYHLLGFWNWTKKQDSKIFIRRNGLIGGRLGQFIDLMSRGAKSHPEITDDSLGAEAIKGFWKRTRNTDSVRIINKLRGKFSDSELSLIDGLWTQIDLGDE